MFSGVTAISGRRSTLFRQCIVSFVRIHDESQIQELTVFSMQDSLEQNVSKAGSVQSDKTFLKIQFLSFFLDGRAGLSVLTPWI